MARDHEDHLFESAPRVGRTTRDAPARLIAAISQRSERVLSNAPGNERGSAALEGAAVAIGAGIHGLGMTAACHVLGVESLPAAAGIGVLTAAALVVFDAKSNGVRTADRVARIAAQRAPDLRDILTVNKGVATKALRPVITFLTSGFLASGLAMHHFDGDIDRQLATWQAQVDSAIANEVRPEAEATLARLRGYVESAEGAVAREAERDPRLAHDAALVAVGANLSGLRDALAEERDGLRQHESLRDEAFLRATCEEKGNDEGVCAGTTGKPKCGERCQAAQLEAGRANEEAGLSRRRIATLEAELATTERDGAELRQQRPEKPAGLVSAEDALRDAIAQLESFDLSAEIRALVESDPRREVFSARSIADRLAGLFEMAMANPGLLVMVLLVWGVAAVLESLAWLTGFLTRTPQYDDDAATDLIGVLRVNTRALDADYIRDAPMRAERRAVARGESAEQMKLQDELELFIARETARAHKAAWRMYPRTWLGALREWLRDTFTR